MDSQQASWFAASFKAGRRGPVIRDGLGARRRLPLWLGLLLCGLLSPSDVAFGAEPPVPEKIDFNRDVRPILADNCFACHGPDANHRKADLRLDQRDDAINASAILVGDAAASPVIVRILSDDDDARMPPPSANKRLSARQRQILQRWIDQGAVYQKHWSYEPPVKGAVSAQANGVDHWVSRRLSSLGLKPVPLADRRVLIRRLYADLLGLPPTPEEVNHFVNDAASDAYERLVERVLKNPHYGERMAIGWLDVVRFADTIGYHSDNPRNVWPYRDWVIRSFNENKPFDRFTLEQIAGDLLPDASDETRVGSAFNRLLLSTEEGGAQPKDYEARMLTDRVRAVGTAWLGQTTGCAQCHDHKFDPFTQRDFYSLGAFFADVQEPIVGRREEGLVVALGDDLAKLQSLDQEMAELKRTKRATDEPATEEAVKTAERVRKAFHDSLPRCLVTASAAKLRVVRILPRGNWMDESGEVVRPALPHYLPQPKISGRELNRLDLARWLVSRENPLTARVFVNRVWKQLFGAGLSRVVDDLGAQGEPPANPELLDWLACDFMDSGWDVKQLVKAIVLSETYRRSSVGSPELAAADPNNREWARQSPFRLDAELVRDYALAISGLLSPRIGGPSVKPYQPDGYWENLNFPTRQYVADDGESQYRRGVYTWWQRTFLHPSMLAFDAPSREECCADRPRSNIPQQALVLLNDPTYVEAARALAAKVLLEGPKDDEGRIVWAWQRAIQRRPDGDEVRTLSELLARRRAFYKEDAGAAAQLVDVGFAPLDKRLDANEVAAWTHVARVLLNLHETITRP